MAHVNDKKKEKKSSFAINENVQDLISVFYYLRNFYDTSSLKEGEDISLNMFFDQENYLFKLRFLGRETIKTAFGKVRCLKLRPFVQSGRVFSEQESITLGAFQLAQEDFRLNILYSCALIASINAGLMCSRVEL